MKKLFILFAAAAMIASCTRSSQEKINYPVTKTGDVVDTVFGTPVPDPYRWLEDDMSDETDAWVKEQNVVTFGYLSQIPYRDQIKERLTTMWNYEKIISTSQKITDFRTSMFIIARKRVGNLNFSWIPIPFHPTEPPLWAKWDFQKTAACSPIQFPREVPTGGK
jgi:hypothetical protein